VVAATVSIMLQDVAVIYLQSAATQVYLQSVARCSAIHVQNAASVRIVTWVRRTGAVLQVHFEDIVEKMHLPAVYHQMALMQQASDAVKEVGNQLVAEKRHKAAAAKYKEALGICSWNHSAVANRAMCLMKGGKLADALECAVFTVQVPL
jgi:hypothetical protein